MLQVPKPIPNDLLTFVNQWFNVLNDTCIHINGSYELACCIKKDRPFHCEDGRIHCEDGQTRREDGQIHR